MTHPTSQHVVFDMQAAVVKLRCFYKSFAYRFSDVLSSRSLPAIWEGLPAQMQGLVLGL
jgi:hypothetical protein